MSYPFLCPAPSLPAFPSSEALAVAATTTSEAGAVLLFDRKRLLLDNAGPILGAEEELRPAITHRAHRSIPNKKELGRSDAGWIRSHLCCPELVPLLGHPAAGPCQPQVSIAMRQRPLQRLHMICEASNINLQTLFVARQAAWDTLANVARKPKTMQHEWAVTLR